MYLTRQNIYTLAFVLGSLCGAGGTFGYVVWTIPIYYLEEEDKKKRKKTKQFTYISLSLHHKENWLGALTR